MKEKLLNKLFEEFDKDKQVIKQNLLQVMDVIMLETNDEFGKVTMIIKYERDGGNETNNNKK